MWYIKLIKIKKNNTCPNGITGGMEKSMETKIMMSTEKGIKAELLKGRKASIEVAKRIHACIEKWEETDTYKSAKDFLIDRLSFNPATISKYNRAVEMFSLTDKDSPYNTFAISTLCELLRIGREATDALLESGEISDESTQAEIKSMIALVKKEDAEAEAEAEAETEAEETEAESEADTEADAETEEDIKKSIIEICVNAKMGKRDVDTIIKYLSYL